MAGTTHCVIIDDDPLVSTALTHLIASVPDLHLAGIFTNPREGLTYLNSNPVDLAFIDVLMPEMSGFELLDALEKRPGIIICSNKKEYAVDAFGIDAIDYLHKPILPDRFAMAIAKFKTWHKQQQIAAPNRKALFLKIEGIFRKIDFSEIIYIEKEGNYLRVVTEEVELLPYSTMKELEAKLPTEQFFRVHRSYIVNMERVEGLDENFLITDKKLIPISKERKKSVYDYLGLS